MNDEWKGLKKQLDEQVFINHNRASQKKQILQRITSNRKKTSRIVHTCLAIAALFLFSILSISFLYSEDVKPAQEDKELPVVYEEKEKTGEEWKQTFLEIWSKPREPFRKLQLDYTLTSHHVSGVRTLTNKILVKYEDGELSSKTSVKVADTGETEFETNEDIYLVGQQVTYVNHSEKNHSSGEITGTAKDLFNESTYIPLVPITPMYSFSPILSDAYTWSVEEMSVEKGWVLIQAELKSGDEYAVKSYRIKIDIEHAIILELTTFNANDEMEDAIEVQKVLINDEVETLNFEFVIPQDYTDLEREGQELVQVLFSWFEKATDAIKNDPSYYDTLYTGEGKYLSLVLTVKESVDEESAKELAKKFLYAFTKEANASEGFSQKGITIWEQYAFDLLIFEPNDNKYSYKGNLGKQIINGMPEIEWEN